jgi:tetratricopeptide (TPR) repeat protein/transcriptional regulator with XRE-family HTH domain
VADQGSMTFGGLLRRLRTDAGLTQEELAKAARVSARSVSDLERGVNLTARKDTARLLADALHLTGPARAGFEAAARSSETGSSGAAMATRTLPRDVTSFTGRQRQLQELVDALADSSGVVSIHAIGGMAGIGKTAFAVHAAHRLADRFPAGQIFLPLHGHTPGQRPVDPGDALASLLLMAGVAASQIPPGVEARMALWRDRLAGQQLLLILDDAASSEQVSPLLPGTGGSLVLITSRRHLIALDDATAISLDTLPPGDAAALFVQLTARPGLSQADPAVAGITELCGYLPLAIGMVARQLHHHPAWSPAAQAGELAEALDRLELMATENLSVAAAFNLSYEDLAPDQQRLFRRLGLHPGTDIDAYAAAALDGTDPAAARRGLEALYDQYLLTEPTRGRYRMHDLIREHARALAGRLDPDSDRDQAIARLLDYYQHTAALVGARLARQTRPGRPPAGPAGLPAGPTGLPAVPAGLPAVPGLDDAARALAWARANRASLSACLDHANGTGQHARVIALTAALAGLWRRDGPWTDAMSRHAAASQVARALADPLAEANALTDLGDVRELTGDNTGAVQALERALDLYREVGDRLGQANALNNLGDVRRLTGDQPGAVRALQQALDLYREVGDRLGQASALNKLGGALWMTGDYPGAVRALERALDLYRDLGDRFGQAWAFNDLGIVRRLTGDYPEAVEALEQALGICRDLGNRLGQANALKDLGATLRMTGDYPEAVEALEQALDIYREVGNRSGEAEALNEAGTLYLVSGDPSRAEDCHQQALKLARAIPSSRDEACALAGLARCASATGRTTLAKTLLGQAHDIFRRIGAAETAGVLAELDTLSAPETAE